MYIPIYLFRVMMMMMIIDDDADADADDDELLKKSYKATKLQSSWLEIHGQSIDQDCHQCRCCITSRS